MTQDSKYAVLTDIMGDLKDHDGRMVRFKRLSLGYQVRIGYLPGRNCQSWGLLKVKGGDFTFGAGIFKRNGFGLTRALRNKAKEGRPFILREDFWSWKGPKN